MRYFRILSAQALLLILAGLGLANFAAAQVGSNRQQVPSSRSYGDDISLEQLHEAAGSAHVVTRIDAVRRIAAEANPVSMQTLIEALKDSEPAVREMAAIGLGRIGRPESVPALVVAMSDENETVRSQAAVAIAGITPSADVVNGFLAGLDEQHSKTVGRKGSRAFTRSTSEHETDDGHGPAALGQSSLVMSKKVLRRMVAEDPATARLLIASLTDANPVKRYAAAYALSTSTDPEVGAALEAALDRKDAAVVNGAYEFYLADHLAEAKAVLLRGLGVFDDPDLILAMSRCGDRDLEQVAAQVANEKGVWLGR